MAIGNVNRSIVGIAFAPLGVNGAIGTVWTEIIGLGIVPGSAKLSSTSQTIESIKVLNGTDNDYISYTKDKEVITIEAAFREFDPTTMVLLKGGSIGVNGSYIAPATAIAFTSLSMKVITEPVNGRHQIWLVPQADITLNPQGDFKPDDTLSLKFVAKFATPTNANGDALSPYEVQKVPSAPTVSASTATTLTFVPTSPFVATDYEYKVGSGSYSNVSVNPITGLATTNVVTLRVKAVALSHESGLTTVKTLP